MILKKIILVFAFLVSLSSFAQIRTGVYFSDDQKYKDVMEEFGNPLPGDPIMILQTVTRNYGNFVWYLNESPAKESANLYDQPKDLHAGIFLEDHDGLIPQISFKDFAHGLAQPKYLTGFCTVEDANEDGFPEFYLTYFEASDGLDAKPLKVIVYTDLGHAKFSKSKITGWIPFQDGDEYRVERDANFKVLPQVIKLHAEKILEDARNGMN